MEIQGTKKSQNNLEKTVGGHIIPNFKTQQTATIIKTVCYWHKEKHIDQWYRTKSPEINPYINGQMISSKCAKKIKQTKSSLFNKWCKDNIGKNEIGPLLYTIYNKLNELNRKYKAKL